MGFSRLRGVNFLWLDPGLTSIYNYLPLSWLGFYFHGSHLIFTLANKAIFGRETSTFNFVLFWPMKHQLPLHTRKLEKQLSGFTYPSRLYLSNKIPFQIRCLMWSSKYSCNETFLSLEIYSQYFTGGVFILGINVNDRKDSCKILLSDCFL